MLVPRLRSNLVRDILIHSDKELEQQEKEKENAPRRRKRPNHLQAAGLRALMRQGK